MHSIPSADQGDYPNMRSWIYWQIRSALEAGRLALPDNQSLLEELLAQRWTVTSSGKKVLVKKHQFRSDLGRSPDYSDALATTYGLEGQLTVGGSLGVYF